MDEKVEKTGKSRLAAYQGEKPFVPLLLQRYFRCMEDILYEWNNHQQEHLIGK